MNNDQMDAQRYSVLGQTWASHNQSQLQWPVVAVGVILVGLGSLVASGGKETTDAISSLGRLRSPIVGTFFLLAGVITFLMVRTMKRAREIMAQIEQVIDTYDRAFGIPIDEYFSSLNHRRKPSGRRGLSGPLLLALVLILMATLSGIIGLCLILGRAWYGIIALALVAALGLLQSALVFRTYTAPPRLVIEKSSEAAKTGQS